jgi:hypothetical protein
MLVQIYMNARLGKKVASDISALEDMCLPASEEEMEAVLGELVDEAIRVVEEEDDECMIVT